MQNNSSTLSGYNSLFVNHIQSVDQFNDSTNDWLSNSEDASNLFFEEASNRIVQEELGLLQDKLSTRQKILTAIKEIADSSKAYLDRLVRLSGVLNALIKIMDSE